MQRKIVIVGAGGFGREVQDIFEARAAAGDDLELLGFIVDARYGAAGSLVHGLPILGGFEWLRGRAGSVQAICAVGAPELRRRLVDRIRAEGVGFCNAIHPAATMTSRVHLGEGIVIAAGTILTNNIRVGSHTHLNLACTVGHDAVIEELVTVSPGVHLSGNVTLSEGCVVGTGSNLIERTTVGAWSVVGAGTTVIRDVPANATVVGVPGKVVKQRDPGWHLAGA